MLVPSRNMKLIMITQWRPDAMRGKTMGYGGKKIKDRIQILCHPFMDSESGFPSGVKLCLL